MKYRILILVPRILHVGCLSKSPGERRFFNANQEFMLTIESAV